MLRKILFSVFTLILIAGLIFAFFHFRRMKTPVMEAVKAIPLNASLVFRVNQFSDLAEKLNIGNLFWEELLNIQNIQKINSKILFLDSLIKNNNVAWETFDVNQAYISFHPVGAEKYEYLFAISVPSYVKEDDIKELIASAAPNAFYSTRSFENFNILQISSSNESYAITFINGVFILSPSSVLIEDAIRQVNSQKSFEDDYAFNRIISTAGTRINANVIVNYASFFKQFNTILNEEGKEILKPFQDLFNTSAMDVSVRPNSIMLNGFSISYDTIPGLQNHLKKQKPQEIEVIRVLPQSTAFMMFSGFSNFSAYYSSLKKNKAEENKTDEDLLTTWIGNEIAWIKTDEKSNFANYLIIKSGNLESANQSLLAASSKLSAKENKQEDYRDFVIKKLANENIYQKILGKQYAGIDTTYYTNIGRYFIFGSSIQNLQYFLNEFLAERTLQRDSYYASFSENLSTEANFFVYSNIPRSLDLYKPILNDQLQGAISDHQSSVNKFEAWAWQVINNDDLFYNNFYLKFNPQFKEETQSLFETSLDNLISSSPVFLQNHLNNTKDIFVQDDENIIYLIGNTGKILWSKDLGEKIISEIYQVDAFKNNKLQILFNTSDKIYLLDRNGNYVENYPVLLPSSANAGLNVFDYENSKEYRILISCADNMIYNYAMDGKQVKGFIPIKTSAPVFAKIKHATIGGKDYLIAVDSDGRVNVFDRKGEARLKLKERFFISPNHNTLFLEKGRDLSRTYLITTDSLGTVLKLNLNDELEKINMGEISKNHLFLYSDLDNDKVPELIFTDELNISVYDQKFNKLWVYPHESKAIPETNLYLIDGVKLGFTSSSSEEIFLLDENGNIVSGFPIKGKTSFSIADLNNDRHLNLVTALGRNIYLYQIK
jgi:hypothetical protein